MKRKQNGIGLYDLVKGFLFSLQADGRAPRTHEYYHKLLRHLLHYAEIQKWPVCIHSIDTIQIRQFLSWVGTRNYDYITGNGSHRQVKPNLSTPWPYYKAVRRFFAWVVEEGYLKDSPVDSIRFKAPSLAMIQPYSLEELKRFLAVCDLDIRTGARFTGIRNKAMLLLFLDSALRRTELGNLLVNDIDLDSKRVRVIGKGNKVSIVQFSARTAKALWIWLIERKSRARTDRLWITEEGIVFVVNNCS